MFNGSFTFLSSAFQTRQTSPANRPRHAPDAPRPPLGISSMEELLPLLWPRVMMTYGNIWHLMAIYSNILWQLSCSFFLEHLWQGLSSESYLCDNSYSYELWHQHEIRKGKSIVCRQENTGTTQVCVCAHGFINSFLSARRWYFSTASHNLAHTLPAARCHTPTVSTSIVPGPSFSDQWPSDSWFVLRQLHHWCTQSFGFVRYASFFRPKTKKAQASASAKNHSARDDRSSHLGRA